MGGCLVPRRPWPFEAGAPLARSLGSGSTPATPGLEFLVCAGPMRKARRRSCTRSFEVRPRGSQRKKGVKTYVYKKEWRRSGGSKAGPLGCPPGNRQPATRAQTPFARPLRPEPARERGPAERRRPDAKEPPSRAAAAKPHAAAAAMHREGLHARKATAIKTAGGRPRGRRKCKRPWLAQPKMQRPRLEPTGPAAWRMRSKAMIVADDQLSPRTRAPATSPAARRRWWCVFCASRGRGHDSHSPSQKACRRSSTPRKD